MDLLDIAGNIGTYDTPKVPVIELEEFCNIVDKFCDDVRKTNPGLSLSKFYCVTFHYDLVSTVGRREVRESNIDAPLYSRLACVNDILAARPNGVDLVDCGLVMEDGREVFMTWCPDCNGLYVYAGEFFEGEEVLYKQPMEIKGVLESAGVKPDAPYRDLVVRKHFDYQCDLERFVYPEDMYYHEVEVEKNLLEYSYSPRLVSRTSSKSLAELGVCKIVYVATVSDWDYMYIHLNEVLDYLVNYDNGASIEALLYYIRVEFIEHAPRELVEEFWRGLDEDEEIKTEFVHQVSLLLTKAYNTLYEMRNNGGTESGESLKVECEIQGELRDRILPLNCSLRDLYGKLYVIKGEDTRAVVDVELAKLDTLQDRELVEYLRDFTYYIDRDLREVAEKCYDIFTNYALYGRGKDEAMKLAKEFKPIVIYALRRMRTDGNIDRLIETLKDEFFDECNLRSSRNISSIDGHNREIRVITNVFSEYCKQKGNEAFIALLKSYRVNNDYRGLLDAIKMTEEYIGDDESAGRPRYSEVHNSSFWEYYYYQCTADLFDVHWEGVVRLSSYYSGGWD